MKNYFYSTLRRQLRKLLRKYKGDQSAEPKEINVKFLRGFLKENNVPYKEIDNVNIRNLIVYLDKKDNKSNTINEPSASINLHSKAFK